MVVKVSKVAAKKAVAKKVPALKAAPKAVEVPREEQTDSMGRRIGKRGQRRDLEDGTLFITASERQMLRDLASRVDTKKGASAFDRAMALEAGEWDVIDGKNYQSFVMSLAQARKQDTLEGREFNYTTATFAPGVGHPAVSLLYIQRTA